MNVAMLIAGGSGQRMHQDIPKQFLNVNDKPVIIYTLEAFQKHPSIDAILVVCIDGWKTKALSMHFRSRTNCHRQCFFITAVQRLRVKALSR